MNCWNCGKGIVPAAGRTDGKPWTHLTHGDNINCGRPRPIDRKRPMTSREDFRKRVGLPPVSGLRPEPNPRTVKPAVTAYVPRAPRRRPPTRKRATLRTVCAWLGSRYETVQPAKVFARDKRICHICGDIAEVPTLDHIVPISLGGDNTYANVATACSRCNSIKGSDPELVDITALLTLVAITG